MAECRSPNITEYYASVMLPGTTELLIIMELMASSVNDLVRLQPFFLCMNVCAIREAFQQSLALP